MEHVVNGNHSIRLALEIGGASSEEEGFYLGRQTGNSTLERSEHLSIKLKTDLVQCQVAVNKPCQLTHVIKVEHVKLYCNYILP